MFSVDMFLLKDGLNERNGTRTHVMFLESVNLAAPTRALKRPKVSRWISFTTSADAVAHHPPAASPNQSKNQDAEGKMFASSGVLERDLIPSYFMCSG